MPFFTTPDFPSLMLLLSTIGFFIYYRFLLRHWLKAYWAGIQLSQWQVVTLRRLGVPLESTMTELLRAHHDGHDAQKLFDRIYQAAVSGQILSVEEASHRD